MDAVEVGLGVRRVPGVKVVRHHFRRQHPDIHREMLVQGQRQLFGRDTGIGMEVQRKPQRMNAGVGAAASLDVGSAAQHRFHRILHGLRNTPAVGLHLKAAVVGAVVA